MDVNDFKNWANRERALDQLGHKTLVLLATDWAYSVLPIYEAEYPEDNRPRKAIEAAEQWVNISPSIVAVQDAGNSTDTPARRASYAAHTAAQAAAWDTNAAAYAAHTAAHTAWAAAYTAWDTAWDTAYAAWNAALATYDNNAPAPTPGDDASKWEWLYKTYLQALGPENKTFNDNWITPTVKSLLYDTSLSSIIADALEDAGCDNNDILQHLRNNKEWIRADWVLRKLSCT
jgi:hypothetical protein